MWERRNGPNIEKDGSVHVKNLKSHDSVFYVFNVWLCCVLSINIYIYNNKKLIIFFISFMCTCPPLPPRCISFLFHSSSSSVISTTGCSLIATTTTWWSRMKTSFSPDSCSIFKRLTFSLLPLISVVMRTASSGGDDEDEEEDGVVLLLSFWKVPEIR